MSLKLLLWALPIIEIDNSRILDFVKGPKITNWQKFKHAKITKATVLQYTKERSVAFVPRVLNLDLKPPVIRRKRQFGGGFTWILDITSC